MSSAIKCPNGCEPLTMVRCGVCDEEIDLSTTPMPVGDVLRVTPDAVGYEGAATSFDPKPAVPYMGIARTQPKSAEEREQNESRREKIVRAALEAADRILVDQADGTAEEIDYLTSRVAHEFAGKVLCAATAKLLRKDMAS